MLISLTAQERMLPFELEHHSVTNPAFAAWSAALGGQGPQLAPELDVYYYRSPAEKAVVYAFHGGQGTAGQWITREEEAALVSDLARANYSVVFLESVHRPLDSNWLFPNPRLPEDSILLHQPAACNATINANELLLRGVHTRLGFDASTKIYLVGFSSGAKFACAMAYNLKLDPPAIDQDYYTSPRTGTAGGLNVRAAGFYNNVCVPYYLGNYAAANGDPLSAPKALDYSTPSIFNYSECDEKNDTSEVEANANFLETLPTPVPVEKNLARRARLTIDRFTRVLGVSFAESRGLYAELIADPLYVDADGYVLSNADGAEVVTGLPERKEQSVRQQLKVLRAEHHVSAEFHDRTVAFFDTHG
jgi:hypothetical protein